jgi:hypothetical protein
MIKGGLGTFHLIYGNKISHHNRFFFSIKISQTESDIIIISLSRIVCAQSVLTHHTAKNSTMKIFIL